jgi:hypothetical protein
VNPWLTSFSKASSSTPIRYVLALILVSKSNPPGLSHVQPTFALVRASTLILVLCVPHPRHTITRKAMTVRSYRITATMRTALSLTHAADIPGAS